MQILRELLDLPVEGYVAPMLAAGSLARLGDPSGLAAIERGLASSNHLVRRIATKQLFHFDGVADVGPLFERALADEDRGVADQARAELRELGFKQPTHVHQGAGGRAPATGR